MSTIAKSGSSSSSRESGGFLDDDYILKELKNKKRILYGVICALETKFFERQYGRVVSSQQDIKPYGKQYNRYEYLQKLIVDMPAKNEGAAFAGIHRTAVAAVGGKAPGNPPVGA